MLAGLSLAIALLAQAAAAAPADPAPDAGAPPAYGPSHPTPPKPPVAKPPVDTAEGGGKPGERCGPAPATTEPGDIVVCVQRPEGYRLNPDVIEAKRALRSGRPKRPERMADTSCASVGPFGCTPGAGIDLIGGAIVAATMVARAVRGENVGAMFVTDPQLSEYEHYVEAKRVREAEEAEAAAAAKAKAKNAAADRSAEPGPAADE